MVDRHSLFSKSSQLSKEQEMIFTKLLKINRNAESRSNHIAEEQ